MRKLKFALFVVILLAIILIFTGCKLEIVLQDKDEIINTIQEEIPNAALVDFTETEDGCERTYIFDNGSFKFRYNDRYEYTRNLGIYSGQNESDCNYMESLIFYVAKDCNKLAQTYGIKIVDLRQPDCDYHVIEQYKKEKQLLIVIENLYVYRIYVSTVEQIGTLFEFINECAKLVEPYIPTDGSKLCIEKDIDLSIKYWEPFKDEVKNPKYADAIIDCFVPLSKRGCNNLDMYKELIVDSFNKTITNGYLKDEKPHV